MTPFSRRGLLTGVAGAILATRRAHARTVTDAAGRAVELPERVGRVFVAGPPASVFVYALAPEKLLGWTREFRGREAEYVTPRAAALPVLGRLTGRGGDANLEVVLAARPDLILDVGSTTPTYVSLAERVQAQTGVPYLLVDGRFENTSGALRLLGDALGAAEQAGRLAAYAEAAFAEVDAVLARTPETDRPRVYLARGPEELVYRQIEGELRAAIRDGRLRSGVRLPGIRAFARRLGVAAVTVMTAYDQLTAEGYLEPRPGVGTLVAPEIPDPRSTAPPTPRSSESQAVPALTARGPSDPFFASWASPTTWDFRTGSTSLDLFPVAVWERMLKAAWRDLSAPRADGATTYVDSAGDPLLREQLATYLGASRGVRCLPETIVVTAGAQAAMAAANQAWLGPGRTLVVEDPGSPNLQRTFATLGTRLAHVAVDDRGLPVTGLPAGANGVLVTPSWQYPRGGTLPVARRIQLLAWARANRAIVIEDDCDSELRYAGHPLPSLQGLDDDGRVIYVGTFSKVLFPGLRTGYAVVPKALYPAYLARVESLYRGPGAVEQRALARFIEEGHFHRHLARLRTVFAERQAAAIDALTRKLGDVVTVDPAPAGTHLVVRIEHERLRAPELARSARARGVAIETVTFATPVADADALFLLHYARHDPPALAIGIGRLAEAFGACLRQIA